MANRTIDIVKLRQAARLCRAKIEVEGAGADAYVRLAAEIDALIGTLSTENKMCETVGRGAAAT